jgi:hypothetical protein
MITVQVICWFTGPREVERDVLVIHSAVKCLADKFAAIIDLDTLWL